MEDLIIRPPAKISGTVEICRSFAYKLSPAKYTGVTDYESRDFFASMKVTCDAADTVEISRDVDEFVQAEVMDAVKDYVAKLRAQRERKAP